MTRDCLVDVNVLLPLLLPQHSAHTAAKEWLARRPRPGVVHFALPTQLGVLRLLGQALVMGTAALSPQKALQTWDDLVLATGLQDVPAVPPVHAQHLRRLVSGRSASPNLWTDVWLAALALALDYEMVTFDRGFQSFGGLKLNLLRA